VSYYPEAAHHILELLLDSVEFNDPAMRQHLLDTWLEEIHTPLGTAEHNLCAYVGILSARPEQPMDFEHLQALVREADLAWYSSASTHIQRDEKRQAGTKKERRPEISAWIREQILKRPEANREELYDTAPDWITDKIGPGSFKKRVSKVRGENK
jgi:hypothetical protein